MIRLFVRHTVADYAEWRKAYNALEAVRSARGVVDHAVYQAADNQKNVTVWHDFVTLEEAEAFRAQLLGTMPTAEGGHEADVWYIKQEEAMTSEDYRTEFGALRTEIERRSQEQNTTERQTAYGIVAVYAVLLGYIETKASSADNFMTELRPFLWWVPLLITVYGLIRWSINDQMIGLIGKYLSGTPINQWELFIKDKITWPWHSIRLVWYVVILVTFTNALSVTLCGSPTCLIKDLPNQLHLVFASDYRR